MYAWDGEFEIEQSRRSLAMLSTGAAALSREQALEVAEKLSAVTARLQRLEAGLRQLLDD